MIHEPKYPSAIYEQFRPSFPYTLFQFIAEKVPFRNRALDCAAGTGKASRALKKYFQQVIGIDKDFGMLNNAVHSPSVFYMNSKAEQCALKEYSFDLIFIGQALHWFGLEQFYTEAQRILVSGGIIAAACYHRPRIESSIDRALDRLFNEILGGYWHPNMRYLNTMYTEIPFPFERIPAPAFEISARWNIRRLFGFLNTWSAVSAYRKARKKDPIKKIETSLYNAWGDPVTQRRVRWPVRLIVGQAT